MQYATSCEQSNNQQSQPTIVSEIVRLFPTFQQPAVSNNYQEVPSRGASKGAANQRPICIFLSNFIPVGIPFCGRLCDTYWKALLNCILFLKVIVGSYNSWVSLCHFPVNLSGGQPQLYVYSVLE